MRQEVLAKHPSNKPYLYLAKILQIFLAIIFTFNSFFAQAAPYNPQTSQLWPSFNMVLTLLDEEYTGYQSFDLASLRQQFIPKVTELENFCIKEELSCDANYLNPIIRELINTIGGGHAAISSEYFSTVGQEMPKLELRGDIAIITITDFYDVSQAPRRFHNLLQQAKLKKAKKLVLDLRINRGGWEMPVLGMLAAFIDKPSMSFELKKSGCWDIFYDQGKVFWRTGNKNPANFIDVPLISDVLDEDKRVHWDDPVAVVVSRYNGSGGEYMAYYLQKYTSTLVIGEPTMGLLNTAMEPFRLPNGAYFYLTVRTFSMDGTANPERVTPDIFINDQDPQNPEYLDEALRILNDKKGTDIPYPMKSSISAAKNPLYQSNY